MEAMIANVEHLQLVLAAAGFLLFFPSVSFLVNRRLTGDYLATDRNQIALLSSLVFSVAILCEASINPLYEYFFSRKLWEYRIFPLHDGNVSALGIVVWTAYGVHLYFFNQTLDRWLSASTRPNVIKAVIMGCEAPLIWEVFGNSYFLATTGEYYAYYLPDDIFHLTSFQVVPFYIVCIYAGLRIYDWAKDMSVRRNLPYLLYPAGLAFLMSSQS